MTDDLIARLRSVKDWWRAPGHLAEQCADALEAQARRIAELGREIERKDLIIYKYDKRIYFLMDKEKAKDARIAELEAALRPFADKAKVFHDYVDDYPIMFGAEPPLRVGDLRAARAALGEKEPAPPNPS